MSCRHGEGKVSSILSLTLVEVQKHRVSYQSNTALIKLEYRVSELTSDFILL